MSAKFSAKIPQVDYQEVLDNYARGLARMGVSTSKLANMSEEHRNYLLSSPHSLTRLLSARFNRNHLEDLSRNIPLSYYAEVQENKGDPLALVQDQKHFGLKEGQPVVENQNPEHFRRLLPSRPSRFGRVPQDHSFLWQEGGLPEYVSCIKLGATRDDIHQVMNALTRTKDGNIDHSWNSNPLDVRQARVRHPLGMLADLLDGGGTVPEFIGHLKDSQHDSARLSAISSARMAGASTEQATSFADKFADKPQISEPYFHGANHRLRHEHLVDALRQYPTGLGQYVKHRLSDDLNHRDALRYMENPSLNEIREKSQTTRVRKITPDRDIQAEF